MCLISPSTLRNETGEYWSGVPLYVDVFEPDATLLGSGHTFEISPSIHAGEVKTFTFHRTRRLQKPVIIEEFRISLAPQAAQSALVRCPGDNIIDSDSSDNYETESGSADDHGRTTE